MESALDWHSAKALLEWQIELGATEAIGDSPVDRTALEPEPAQPKALAQAAAPTPAPEVDPVAEARALAGQARSLEALRVAMEGFAHCDLRHGARNLVFADGHATARVMIIGEAPGRDEDMQGRPFVGRAGQLLDRMLAAINLDRTSEQAANAVYITNVVPWRPPQNRDPSAAEIAMCLPFVERHVALAQPEVLVVMGNISCQAVLQKRGITRLRGTWTQSMGLPVLPMFHPAYLLRTPSAKREAWSDLLALKARLRG